MKQRTHLAIALACTLAIGLTGCCGYSFTGGSTGNAKTVSVDYFQNKAPLVNPSLSQIFTEKLKDKLRRETRLTLINVNGDFMFSGTITNYSVAPAAIQSQTEAALNRLTITVNVKFENRLEPTQNFEQSFSNFSDFDGARALTDVEAALIDDITTKLLTDIFNRSVNNW